jgi:hypothetical protein
MPLPSVGSGSDWRLFCGPRDAEHAIWCAALDFSGFSGLALILLASALLACL